MQREAANVRRSTTEMDALRPGAALGAAGVFRNVLITRWPPKYGWLSGPKPVARLVARPVWPTPPQNTELASGTKKPGLSGLAGSPGLPSGSMHAQICD